MMTKHQRLDGIVAQLRGLVEDGDGEGWQPLQLADVTPARLAAEHIGELILGARRLKNRHFGRKTFRGPAWDILLELHVAHHRGQDISVTSAVTFGDCAPTTGLRWLNTLERAGLVIRRDDPRDQRRQFVLLSPEAVTKVDAYLADYAVWAGTKVRMTRR